MKRICFVVQRYGCEVNGGAEYLCRLYAERMACYYDVTVLASCAVDHVTWRDSYSQEDEILNGVKLKRFPVEKERDIEEFSYIEAAYYSNQQRDFHDDFIWMGENGPKCPGIYQYIREHKDEFDVFLFMTYLYYSTTFCFAEASEKSILIPTAHDEAPLNGCQMFRGLFSSPAGFIYLTEEERQFAHQKFGNSYIPSVVTGSGIDIPEEENIEAQKDIFAKHKIDPDDYILYVGRIESGKNCVLLFESFIAYKEKYGGKTKLVLAGKPTMDIPERDDIVWVGFVSEEEKFALIKYTKILLLASQQESLSISVLEGMASGIPVIVNANCDVLKAHIFKSNGGLYFYELVDFVETIHYLLTHEQTRIKMGKNAKKYIENNYTWEQIDKKMVSLIERVASQNVV